MRAETLREDGVLATGIHFSVHAPPPTLLLSRAQFHCIQVELIVKEDQFDGT